MFRHPAHLLSQFCQFPISLSRTRQMVELPKLKSTQPSYKTICPSLYSRHESCTIDGQDLVADEVIIHARRGNGLMYCGLIPQGLPTLAKRLHWARPVGEPLL